MKQKNNKDISILLYALLLFSFGIGWIYSKSTQEKRSCENQIETLVDTQDAKTPENIIIPKTPEPPAEIAVDAEKAAKEEELTTQEILIYSRELVRSESIDRLIAIIKDKCPENILVTTIDQLITRNKEELSRYKKLKIILSLAKYYETDKKIQNELFDLIIKNKDLETGKTPLLFAAVKIEESGVIPALVEWYNKIDKRAVKDPETEALQYATKNDHANVIKKLQENGVKIDPDYATKLLWINLKANKTNKNSRTIETLKNLGANLNNQDAITHVTPLIQAIKNKNLETVKQLVKFGANPKLSSEDKSIGSPLQNTREMRALEIEEFLRSKGARD